MTAFANRGMALGFALALLLAAPAAFAACTEAAATEKFTAINDRMLDLSTRNPAAVMPIVNELGDIMSKPVTDDTCKKLDMLLLKARG